jgi:hypothetical protein
MMYQDKLVTAVKVAGKVLREDKDTVYVPFGSEYSLLIKNKNSLRALVRVEIDGVDATGGTSLILPANGSIDFERFIKDGNFDAGLKFKFIERTKKIEDGPRGIGAEDGLIRIEFEFEQQKPAYVPGPIYGSPIYRSYTPPPLWNGPYYTTASYSSTAGEATLTSTAGMKGATRSLSDAKLGASSVADGGAVQAMNASISSNGAAFVNQISQTLNDAGITVGGSVSDQKFEVGAWFPTDGQKHVMIMKLLGQVGKKKVKEAVTVKTKQQCPTCGTTNKFGTKFCKECGTGLTIV